MKKYFFISVGLFLMLNITINTGNANIYRRKLMIADFNSGTKPNNIGGDFGAWDKDPMDFTQYCIESFSSDVTPDNRGYSLRLDYDIDSPNIAFNGFWMSFNNRNLSRFNTLVIWIKGDVYSGFTSVVKLELKNNQGQQGTYYLTGITKDWQAFEIPYKDFEGIYDFTDMKELILVFEDRTATNKKGSIYIDNIYVTKR